MALTGRAGDTGDTWHKGHTGLTGLTEPTVTEISPKMIIFFNSETLTQCKVVLDGLTGLTGLTGTWTRPLKRF